GVGLVEEQDGAGPFGLVEDAAQVLFGLADVLGDDGGEVDFVEIESKATGEDAGCHGFSGAGGTGKVRVEAFAEGHLFAEAPGVIDRVAVAELRLDGVQLAHLYVGQNQVGPRKGRGDLTGNAFKGRARQDAAP